MQVELGVSERRACQTLGQTRAVPRYTPPVRAEEVPLAGRVIELAAVYGCDGTPPITALLRREGWLVNHKRVERIGRPVGLKVPQKQPKCGRLWRIDGSCVRLRPAYKDHVWAYDFVRDRTHDGVRFKMLTIVDEFTRECLAIDVARKLTSDDVLERLSWLMTTRGVPAPIRSDKGPEFTAQGVRRWLADVQVRTLFIAPGSPWEKGHVESFNGKRRSELLDREIFYSLREAKVLIEWWRQHYHQVQPHSALGYRPPAPETQAVSWPYVSLRASPRLSDFDGLSQEVYDLWGKVRRAGATGVPWEPVQLRAFHAAAGFAGRAPTLESPVNGWIVAAG